MDQKKKIVYLEKLRVFALFMMLYTHSNTAGVMYFENASTGIGSWVSLFFLPISQCCVTLFFMISGVVLLQKREKIRDLYLRRIIPFAGTIVFFVLLQYVHNCLVYGLHFSVLDYCKALYSGGSIIEHWFLYAYLAFLMLLPFLRAIAGGMQENGSFWYLFALAVIFETIFPMWEAVSDWPQVGMGIPLLSNIVLYPLLGHFMERGSAFLPDRKKYLMPVNIAAVIIAFGNCLMNYHSLIYGEKAAYTVTFLTLFTCVLFWNFKCFGNRDKHAAFWIFAGSGVFGTYLLEPQLRYLTAPLAEWASMQKVPYLINLLLLLLMETVGILVANICKKVPLLKKIL